MRPVVLLPIMVAVLAGCGQSAPDTAAPRGPASMPAVALVPSAAQAELEARAARRGLWANRDPVPPWEWRSTEKARKGVRRDPAER